MLKSQLTLSGEEYIDGDVTVTTAKPQLKQPSMYRVLMLNDDYTPMDFVIDVLQKLFGKTSEQATEIMLTVHNEGMASCGIYTKDVAETKALLANEYARECQHPLMCEAVPMNDE